MTKYKSYRFVDGKARWVIVDKCANIININPSKEELICLNIELTKFKKWQYNENNICDRCEKEILTPGNAYREYKKGIWTEKWICRRCNRKEYRIPNSNKKIIYNYSKEELLEFLRQFRRENKRLPTCNDFNINPRYPRLNIYLKYFGSWNIAIEDAGLSNKRYNDNNACDRCGISFEDIERTPLKEYDKKGCWTGKWDCHVCFRKYDPNSIENIRKRLTDSRTNNLNPNSPKGKGDKGQELLCEWKGFSDLNKESDNYSNGTQIDCIDKKTGLYYQVKITYYNSVHKWWTQNFENEYSSIRKGYHFKSLYLFCISKDGMVVERIYELPEGEINKRKSISINKGCPTDSWGNPVTPWYEQYKIKEPEELKKINDIWQKINKN